jgi:uncharacterized protein YegP (UPF0339 family)
MRDIAAIDAELRLVSRAWRVARYLNNETPSTAHIDALLDERSAATVSRFRSTRSKEILMAAKFELFKDKGGDFRFHLKAANGKIIASGQGYRSKAAAEKGIESIKANAPGATVVDKG